MHFPDDHRTNPEHIPLPSSQQDNADTWPGVLAPTDFLPIIPFGRRFVCHSSAVKFNAPLHLHKSFTKTNKQSPSQPAHCWLQRTVQPPSTIENRPTDRTTGDGTIHVAPACHSLAAEPGDGRLTCWLEFPLKFSPRTIRRDVS